MKEYFELGDFENFSVGETATNRQLCFQVSEVPSDQFLVNGMCLHPTSVKQQK